MNDRPFVMLAIPSLQGESSTELSQSIRMWDRDPEFDLAVEYYRWTKPVEYARNLAVEDFLSADWFTHLMMVDDDIVPPANAVRKMLQDDLDVVSALLYVIRTVGGVTYPFTLGRRYNQETMRHDPVVGTGVQAADTIGGGCFLVKREVVEALDKPLFVLSNDAKGCSVASEDTVFARKVRAAGFQIGVDMDLPCEHFSFAEYRTLDRLVQKVGQVARGSTGSVEVPI